MSRRRRSVALMLGLTLTACEADDSDTTRTASLDFPAPPAAPARTVSMDDFAGAEACASCHTDQYEAWATSTHGQAGGVPGPDIVIAPFTGRSIQFADATVTPRVRGGTYEFVVQQAGFEESTFEVSGVIGGAHMI
ncbi:MAG: hypothetical protein ACKVIN_12025, partial [Longimicrobiales bacterium]